MNILDPGLIIDVVNQHVLIITYQEAEISFESVFLISIFFVVGLLKKSDLCSLQLLTCQRLSSQNIYLVFLIPPGSANAFYDLCILKYSVCHHTTFWKYPGSRSSSVSHVPWS